MSDREYYDEETLQSYKESLINRRNSLSSEANKTYTKILNQMIDELPEHFGEDNIKCKKMVEEYIKKESEKREHKNFLIAAWPFIVPIVLILLFGLISIDDFFVNLLGGLFLAIPIVPLGFLILFFLIQWIIGKERIKKYGTFITITLLIILVIVCVILSSVIF